MIRSTCWFPTAKNVLAFPIGLLFLALTPSIAFAQDSDLDGIPDATDNCPNDPNANQLDSDVDTAGAPSPDGIGDVCDNCIDIPNGPLSSWGLCDDQQDADGDGFGNVCDTDFNNDGATGGDDVGDMLAAAQAGSEDPEFDINCDGAAGLDELSEVFSNWQTGAANGPSGYSCAGTQPCPPGVVAPPLPSDVYDLAADSPSSISGKMTPCEFSDLFTSPQLCTQSVLVFDLSANVDIDPPLQTLNVDSAGAWTASGLAPGTVYGFYPRNYAAVALPETTTIGSSMYHVTSGVPTTLPDGSSGFELAGRTEVTTSVSDRGTAQISLPLRLPPGTAGMQPQLSLEYDSQAQNGLAGVGWSVSGLASIRRCATTVGQDGFVDTVDYDGNDRFCWEGERLVPVATGPYWGGDGTEYRTETDRMARVVANGVVGDGPASFTIWLKDGRILTFDEQAHREAARGVGVHTWALREVADRFGNYYSVRYHNVSEAGELWPLGIDYTGKDGASASAPYASVEFVYEARPDLIDGYNGAVHYRNNERLARIDTFTDGTAVTSYWLEYDDAAMDWRSLLTHITECGYDDSGQSHCLRPTQLGWEQLQPIAATRHDPPAGAPGAYFPLVGNFDGSGTIDLAYQGTSETLFYSSPGLSLTQSSLPAPDFAVPHSVFAGAATPGQLLEGDFNGDGRSGIAAWDFTTLRLFNEVASAEPTMTDSLSGIPGQYPKVYVGDFNGDGTDDLLFTQQRTAPSAFTWYTTA